MRSTAKANTALRPAWDQAWALLQRPAPAGMFEALIAAWAEPQRHYHSLQHLQECLTHFEREAAQATHPAEVALGLFFHDAIYELGAADNEARSADWAHAALMDAGVPADVAARVHALVMATRHDAQPSDADAQLLVDIDLSILGAPPARFAAYEAQIRREYAHVAPEVFEPRRRQLLGAFLARDPIYLTPSMRARCETQARANLALAIRPGRE